MRSAPIDFRPVDLAVDYPVLCSWWDGHGSLHVPKVILPRGWIASGGGVPIAACFIYIDREAEIAVIEWMTTNPQFAVTGELLSAVKGLYHHLEETARNVGCLSVISFVKPNSGEQRIMMKMGYATSAPKDDPGHLIYAKVLFGEKVEPSLARTVE